MLVLHLSLVFSRSGVPKKHKNGSSRSSQNPVLTHRRLLNEAPGVLAMEQLFQRLSGVLFCVKDREGRYLAVNDAFLRRARVSSPEDLIGRTAQEFFPPLLAAGYEQQDSLVISREREIHDRLEMITNPDGDIGWYLSDKVPVRNHDGHVIAIAGVSRDLQSTASHDPRYAKLAWAIEHMQEHYDEPLRIGELVAQTDLSLSSFERLMRSLLKVSPRQLLTRIRVEAATEQLRDTDTPLGRIALDCGFCYQATFCLQFKTTTGMTDLQFRKLSRT